MARPIKAILIGESGDGKTGAVASLCGPFNVRHVDLDNGANALLDLITSEKPGSKYPRDAIEHYRWETLSEKMRFTTDGRIVPATATVWPKMIKLLEEGKFSAKSKAEWSMLKQDIPAADFGGILKWTDKDVLVVDTMSTAGTAAQNFHLSFQSALGTVRTQNEWRRDIGAAQSYLDTLLQLVSSDQVKCNVLLLTHITYAKADGTLAQPGEKDPATGMDVQMIGFPSTIGRAQTKNVAKLFNDVLLVKRVGSTSTIYTKSQGQVKLKTGFPTRVKDQYPQETGLLQYFRDVRGEKG